MSTKSFAKNIVNYSYNRITQEQMHEAKRCFINWLGCVIGSHRHPSINAMLQAVDLMNCNPQATFLGSRIKSNIYFASILNGMSGSMYDYDDTLLDTIIHPGACVYPALVTWYEYSRLPLDDFFKHFIIGVEAEQRVGLFLTRKGHYEKGWHITSTCGIFGSTAAMGRIFELDELEMTYALGIASTQCSGLREMFGTYTKPIHAGKSAANGLLSAYLAKNGLTSSEKALEAEKGLGFLMSDCPDTKYIDEDWTDDLSISQNSYKPYACGIVAHPAIYGACLLHKKGLDVNNILKIEIIVHPLAVELTGNQDPKDQLEAIFSVQHGVAVGLIEGKGGQWQFSDKKVNDPYIKSFRKRVECIIDNNMGIDQAIVKVHMTDGSILTERVEKTLGSIKMPLTDSDIENKFRDLVDPYLTRENQDRIIEIAWGLEKQTNICQLIELCITNK
jgi:2-methylcitrate dehydratase PrpD